MRIIYILLLIVGVLVNFNALAQQRYRNPEAYETAKAIEDKLKENKFDEGIELLKRRKSVFPEYSIPSELSKLEVLRLEIEEADRLFNSGKIANALQAYEKASKYKVLSLDIPGLIGGRVAQFVPKMTAEQKAKLLNKDREILAYKLSDNARYLLGQENGSAAEIKETLNEAYKIAKSIGSASLLTKIENELKQFELIEKLRIIRVKGISEDQKDYFEKLYGTLSGNMPKWLADKKDAIGVEFDAIQAQRLAAVEKQLQALANNCNWKEFYKVASANKATRFTIDEVQGIWDKISVLRLQNRNDAAIGTAFASLKSAIEDFPPNVRTALLNCINEEQAVVLQNYAKQSIIVEKDRVKAIDFYNRAESVVSSPNTKQKLKSEKEKALCDVKLFEPDIQTVVSLMNKCQFGEAERLWNKIADEPQNCSEGQKVREAYASTGRLLLQKIEENNKYTGLTKVITSSTRKNTSTVRRALKEIENLEVCDRSEKRAFLSKYKNIERPYIGVGFEGGTIAYWGGRLEIIAPNGIGIFGTLRTSGTQASQILDGIKQKNKTEAIIGATLRLTGDLYFNVGGGAGYYSIIHRNDYQNSLFLQKQKYAVAYGGLVGKVGQTMAINIGASFMNDGNGFYRPEPTLGLTFNINKR